MNKIEKFRKLLDSLDKECPTGKEDFKYIGTGNPNADILIIGKESSISYKNNTQIKTEIIKNFEQWKDIALSNKFDQSKIEKRDWTNYSPLYPYKGQIFKIDNGNNSGTSRTWYNYQKLYNLIFEKLGNDQIDFHEGVFITEVNSTPSPKTINADKTSIEFRKRVLMRSDFIQSFPIVIIAGVGYFDISIDYNEIEDFFGVKYTDKVVAAGNLRQPYWIHKAINSHKLLINSYQLSINVSDALLEGIAAEIRLMHLYK